MSEQMIAIFVLYPLLIIRELIIENLLVLHIN